MMEIVEVNTQQQRNDFIKFPLNLYKDCQYYIPNVNMFESAMFNNNDDTQTAFFVARDNNQIVGRIAVVINNLYNEKHNLKQARFTRFDCINNIDVAKLLLGTAEKWAMDKGMDTLIGPMGFNGIDYMGIQVSDFKSTGDMLSRYTFPYYEKLLEKLGYSVDASFLDCKIYERKGFSISLDNDKYHNVKTKSATFIIRKYKSQVFDLINEYFINQYGAVPITPKLKQYMIDSFKFLINPDFLSLVVDSNDKLVGVGIAVPGLAKIMQKNKGKLISCNYFEMLKAFTKPKCLEILLVCVDSKYKGEGIELLIASKFVSTIKKYKIQNANIKSFIYNEYKKEITDNFESVVHKKHSVYKKNLV